MDISINKGKIKLKGKLASAEVDGGVLITRPDGTDFNIDNAGEYEAGGISVIGVAAFSTCIYVVEMDDLRICVLNSQIQEKLPSDLLDALGPIDITVSEKSDLAKQTDPYVAIITKAEPGTAEPVLKYSVTSEKLPQELQVVVLKAL